MGEVKEAADKRLNINTLVNRGALALCWVVTLIGCIVIAGATVALYFLFVKGAPPGQPMFLDAVVPPVRGAALHLANGIALTVGALGLRWAIRRRRFSRREIPGAGQ